LRAKNNKYPFFLIILFLISLISQGQNKVAKDDFPKPKGVKNLLFYVQRTININTLVYTLNINKNGELDTEEPIKVNWINYARDTSTESLSYIQRKYAYGIDVKLVDKEKMMYAFNFVSYKKKPIYLIKSQADNTYHAYYTTKTEVISLTRIFIQIEGGSFWVPKVKFIEVTGVNLKNEKVIERIIP